MPKTLWGYRTEYVIIWGAVAVLLVVALVFGTR
jgi:hypothetical protein